MSPGIQWAEKSTGGAPALTHSGGQRTGLQRNGDRKTTGGTPMSREMGAYLGWEDPCGSSIREEVEQQPKNGE